MTEALPTFYVGYTNACWSVNEVLISVGQGRIVKGAPGSSNPVQVEFVTSLVMPPSTAYALWRQLGEFVTDYERKFGKIPVDPSAEPPKQFGNVIGLRGADPKPVSGEQVGDQVGVLADFRFPNIPFKVQDVIDGPLPNLFEDRPEPVVTGGTEQPVTDPSGGGQD